MRVEAIRQWQWVLLSLLIGAAVGYVRQEMAGDLGERYGNAINGQARFEQALITTEQNRPCFTDISVHAQRVPDGAGGTRNAYVVSGDFFNSHYEQRDGKTVARWEPSFFVADIPYKPAMRLDAVLKPEQVRQFNAISKPTVIDFLDQLSAARGVHFTHAWWLGFGMREWLVASVLLIGIVWPITINLLVYGSIRRPPEERGTDLSKVKVHEQPAAKSQPAEEDMEALRAMEDKLQEELANDAVPVAPTQPVGPAPVRSLGNDSLQPVTADANQDPVQFGAKANDYYPTARRPRTEKDARG